MYDRDKVLHGLNSCGYCEGIPNVCGVTECPYENDKPWCTHYLARDAGELIGELLKAQEPRVMTLEEVKSAKLCWIEDDDVDMLYAATYECKGNPSKIGQYAVFSIQADEDDLSDEYADDDNYYLQFMEKRRWLWEGEINITWRAWTSCPTDAQREATPWIKN